jgi:hypothetical protein
VVLLLLLVVLVGPVLVVLPVFVASFLAGGSLILAAALQVAIPLVAGLAIADYFAVTYLSASPRPRPGW